MTLRYFTDENGQIFTPFDELCNLLQKREALSPGDALEAAYSAKPDLFWRREAFRRAVHERDESYLQDDPEMVEAFGVVFDKLDAFDEVAAEKFIAQLEAERFDAPGGPKKGPAWGTVDGPTYQSSFDPKADRDFFNAFMEALTLYFRGDARAAVARFKETFPDLYARVTGAAQTGGATSGRP